MLNQHDQRRLDAIERQLQASDPDLAHALTHWPRPARERWAMAAAVAIAVAGTVGILLGLLALAPVVVVWSALITLAGWIWLFRRVRRAARHRAD